VLSLTKINFFSASSFLAVPAGNETVREDTGDLGDVLLIILPFFYLAEGNSSC
jgi:hypothetical protein